METRGLFWKFFAMISLSFDRRWEKGTEDEKPGNGKIFSDPNNKDLSGYFENFLQWLIICTVGERERKTRPYKKQIQIVFQETKFQPQVQVRSTTIKMWLISNQIFIKDVFL